jgi:PAS domain S-box-containing protein
MKIGDFDKRLVFSLALVVAVLLVNAALDYRNTTQLKEDANWVARSREVLDSLDGLLLSTVDAQTGLRGYLITGDSRYLEPYDASLAVIPDQLRRIRQLTDNNPQQSARISALDKTVSAELKLLQHTEDLHRTDPEAARQIVLAGEGKGLMDSIRSQIGQMKLEEQDVLRERQLQSKSTYRTAIESGIASAAAGLAVVGAFIYLWRRDLVTRTKGAALLHEQREWFRTTLSSIGDAVIATDCEGKIQFMNGVAQSLTGWSEKEAIGRPLGEIFTIINEKSRKTAEDPVSKVLQSGKTEGLANHTLLITRNGTERNIADSGAPIRNAVGDITGVVLVFRDVTWEKHAREIDRLLASIVESSDDAIYAKTLDGTVLSWNTGAERIYGYSASEAIGKNISILIPPDMPNETPEILQRIGRGERIAHYETVRMRKDGSRVYVSMSLSPISDEDGKITGASSLARDITDRKLAEDALKRTAEELDRSNKDLEQFAYVASHDMQEPLRTITGYLQLFKNRYRGQIDDKADKYIGYAVEGAERMSTLIRDLLSYSRINTRGEELRPTDSEKSLEFALKNLQSAIEQSGAAVTHDTLPVVDADKTQLTQLFQNLIGNAIKYRSPERPAHIHVSARSENGSWLFDIRDNGIGFEQQYEDKMFLIFQRLHSRNKYPGTGIGLAICKRIVDRHGGRIWAVGEPGRGATFSFTIPARRQL